MGNRLSTFLVGMGMGIGLCAIFTPKTGRQTRKLLKAKAAEGADYASQRSSEVADRAGEIIERGKRVVERQTEQLADAVEAGRKALQNV